MQRLFSLFLAFFMVATFSLDADARRFGGGKSFGSAPIHRQANKPNAAPNAQRPPAAAPTGGAARWLGPLAGLAAGGLLASMFFGDAFQGIQIFDILLIALVAFVIFRLLRRRQNAQTPAMAGGAPSPMTRNGDSQQTVFGHSVAPTAAKTPAPAWFDEARFLEAAKEHFMALQQHWDANEMDKIAEFVTPQMFQWLKDERESLGEGYQSTYIDELSIQLDGIDELADKTVATLSFSGMAKTSRFDQGEGFNESWRMERSNGPDEPWLIAGIRQN